VASAASFTIIYNFINAQHRANSELARLAVDRTNKLDTVLTGQHRPYKYPLGPSLGSHAEFIFKEPYMRKSIVLAALLSFAMSAHSAPLGLEMGTPLAQLNKVMKLKLERPNLYSTPTVPNSHPDFDDYRLLVTPAHGLCKITAWSKTITTSIYGSELVSRFSSLEDALTTKYGSPKRYDFLRNGSIWNEPRDWMMGLNKKERVLAAFWDGEGREWPDKIQAIELEAVAVGTERAMIRLGYEFKNSSQCIDWIKSQKDSAL
jgi:hypothetical protein